MLAKNKNYTHTHTYTYTQTRNIEIDNVKKRKEGKSTTTKPSKSFPQKYVTATTKTLSSKSLQTNIKIVILENFSHPYFK